MLTKAGWSFLLAAVAVSSLLTGCRTSPESKAARFLERGQALYAQRDYARALLEYRNAASLTPKNAEVQYRMGLVYRDTGSYSQAVEAFQKALKLDPKHSGAELNLSAFMVSAREKKTLEEAEQRLKGIAAASGVEGAGTLAIAELKLGNTGEATRILDEAVQKYPQDLQTAVLNARLKLSQNDPDGAEQVLRKAVSNAPQSAEAALALGRFYLTQRNTEQAERQLRRATELKPNYGAALYSLALTQINANQMDNAEQTCRQLSLLKEAEYQPIYGLFLFNRGKRDAALAEFQRLARENPNDRANRSRLVAAYASVNKFPEATQVLDEALRKNSKDAEALLQRSEIRLRSRDLTGAEKDLSQVLGMEPNSFGAHFALARVHRLAGRSRTERQELTETLRLNPNYLAARFALSQNFITANEPKSALDVLDQAPAFQKQDPNFLTQRNWALLALNRLPQASDGITEAMRAGETADLLVQKALAQQRRGEFAAEQATAEELLKKYPEDSRSGRLLLAGYAGEKKLSKAADKVRQLIAQNQSSVQLRYLLGEVLLELGRFSEAKQAMESVLALNPDFTAAKLQLARLDLSERHLDSARQRVDPVLKADPRNVAALIISADVEQSAGNHAGAVAKYRTAVNVEPSNVLALNNLAFLLANENPAEALTFAQHAVELAPDNAAAQDTLGQLYYGRGMYNEAASYLKKAVASEATPRRLFHLGMCYVKAGNQSLGEQTIQAALKQDPNLRSTEKGW